MNNHAWHSPGQVNTVVNKTGKFWLSLREEKKNLSKRKNLKCTQAKYHSYKVINMVL